MQINHQVGRMLNKLVNQIRSLTKHLKHVLENTTDNKVMFDDDDDITLNSVGVINKQTKMPDSKKQTKFVYNFSDVCS